MLTGSKHYGVTLSIVAFAILNDEDTEFNVIVTSLVGYVIKDCGSYIIC